MEGEKPRYARRRITVERPNFAPWVSSFFTDHPRPCSPLVDDLGSGTDHRGLHRFQIPGKKGAKLEEAGLYDNAALFYYNSLLRNSNNVDARIGLARTGQRVVNDKL